MTVVFIRFVLLAVTFLPLYSYTQTPTLSSELYKTGFTRPTSLGAAGNGRLFVAEIGGIIRMIHNDTLVSTPFLDISTKTFDNLWAGIQSVAFHPDYATNGCFFVLYIRKPDNMVQLSRFKRNTSNSDRADTTETRLLTIPHQLNIGHRGGAIAFGPDGYLYVATGDDSDGGRNVIGDPLLHAQNLSKLFGKILRIGVDATSSSYTVPPSNPYIKPNDGMLDEIWARGLRNPWRMTFDRVSGDLWLGDNGQDGWEEVNFLAKGSPGGANFGWRCYEGNHRYVPSSCEDSTTMTFPLHVYPGYAFNGGTGASVIGGYVYRGSRYPALYGHYIYADHVTGTFTLIRRSPAGGYQSFPQPLTISNPSTFGEDSSGELYVASWTDGALYKLKGQYCPSKVALTQLDPINRSTTFNVTGPVSATNTISTGNVRYTSGQSIDLGPGFTVSAGTVFSATVEGCLTIPATTQPPLQR